MTDRNTIKQSAAFASARASNRSGGGVTLPHLISPSAGTIGATDLTNATIVTDLAHGTMYAAIVTNGGSATNAQIIAGTGGNIVATAVANQAVTALNTQTIASIPGLTTATTYQLKFLHVIPGGESLQASVSFVTA